VDKTIDNDIAWTHGGVVSITFHDDVFLGLNFSFATRAASREVGEESLFVFSNRGMASGHAGEVSA